MPVDGYFQSAVVWPMANLKKIRCELLREMRGSLTQTKLVRKLGYSAQAYSQWELGKAQIKWTEFCQIAKVQNLALSQVLTVHVPYPYAVDDCVRLIRTLQGMRDQREFAKQAGVSTSTMSRWLKGSLEPTLEQMLRLIETCGTSLPLMLRDLMGGKDLISIRVHADAESAERQVHYDHHVAGAVILILRTPTYQKLQRHRVGYISTKLKISLKEERDILAALVQAGAIQMQNGIYTPTRDHLAISGHRQKELDVRKYWIHRMQNYHETSKSPSAWPYLIFSATPETLHILRDRLVALYHEINELTLKEPDGDCIGMFQALLFEVDDIPK